MLFVLEQVLVVELLVVLDQRPLSVEDYYWSWKCSSRGEYILSSEEECHS